jgi:maleate isomerase
MYGWRARIGHIYPAVVAETFMSDFFRMVPDGVTLAMSFLSIEILKKEDLERSLGQMDKAADFLKQRNVDIITIGGAPMVRHLGPGADRQIIERIQKQTGIPTTTSQTAALDAFRELGWKRIVVASPYHDDQNERVRAFLEGSGYTVAGIRGLKKNVAEIHDIPLATAYRHIRETFLAHPGDGIYVPCAHFTAPHIEILEAELGVPVVSSTIATVWQALKILNVRHLIEGEGRLLRSLAPSSA